MFSLDRMGNIVKRFSAEVENCNKDSIISNESDIKMVYDTRCIYVKDLLILLSLTAIGGSSSYASTNKRIRINILKRNNLKTVNKSTQITRKPTHTHIIKPTFTQPHFLKPPHTHNHTLENPHIHTHTHTH